jgi:hypothetical protein
MSWLLRILSTLQSTLYLLLFGILLTGSSLIAPTSTTGAARQYTRPYEFDFGIWTMNALGVKLGQASLNSPLYITQDNRRQIMTDYLELVDTILADENKLSMYYTDPSINDPGSTSAPVRAELAALYKRQGQLAPLAESVLQEQVSAILAELGLTTGGQPIPPVLFHITPLPYNLVISPRDKIQEDASVSLNPNLPVDKQTELEGKVDAGLDVSSLVVPVGGIGTYPTMVERSTSLDWLSDTVAHEWVHNWLTMRPLGMNYESGPEVRTMNETTASIAGSEISALVFQRYYPELAAQYGLPADAIALMKSPIKADFDYRAEMHITRVHVDELLAAGKIEEAEAYMEQRRQVFWDNGYAIRKLNQAYFAFYGAYADVPGGAAGEDPVGPAVRALRARSNSLTVFLKTIAKMTTFQQLQDSLAQ